jgi:hemoglobin-like flavoprotein
MNDQQIYLVQSTFKEILPIADRVGGMFYDRLFALDSSLRPMFPTDLTEQRRKLMNMLALVIGGVHQLDTLTTAVQHLGQRHNSYGVEPTHYQTVGAALLWTLREVLGDKFTPEVGQAWEEVYAVLAEMMLAEPTK